MRESDPGVRYRTFRFSSELWRRSKCPGGLGHVRQVVSVDASLHQPLTQHPTDDRCGTAHRLHGQCHQRLQQPGCFMERVWNRLQRFRLRNADQYLQDRGNLQCSRNPLFDIDGSLKGNFCGEQRRLCLSNSNSKPVPSYHNNFLAQRESRQRI